MLILALDTSGDICSLCLSDDGRLRSTFDFRHDRHLSERLPAAIQFLLSDSAAGLDDVEAIAVGLGPGSFTGVRVGVTSAKTLAQVLELPIIGVHSLDAIAHPYRFLTEAGIVAVVHARREEVVAAFYQGGTQEPVAPAAVSAVGDVRSLAGRLLPDACPLILCGEIDPYPALETEFSFAVRQYASAPSIAALAAPRLLRGETDDVLSMTPHYVAPSPVG